MEFIFELIADLFKGEDETVISPELAATASVDGNVALQMPISDGELGIEDLDGNIFGMMEFH